MNAEPQTEASIRRDQTRQIVEWLRAGPPHDHSDIDRAYADMIERHFDAATARNG